MSVIDNIAVHALTNAIPDSSTNASQALSNTNVSQALSNT